MGGKGSGRPRKHNDEYHRVARELSHQYYLKNREVILYAMKHKIPLDEARKILKPPKKFTGRRKK